MYTSFRQEELNNDYMESLKPAPFHALLGVGISSMCAVLEELRYKNKQFPSPMGEGADVAERERSVQLRERVNPSVQERVNSCHSNKTMHPRHCEEVTDVTDAAIQPFLHENNNFAKKKKVNNKLDRHALLGLAMTISNVLPSLSELDGCHLFTQSLNHLLTCSLPERRCVWSQ